MNNNKGINLIALITMIIIMIILAAIAMKNSFDAHNKSFIARQKEENLNVTTAVQNRYGEYVTNPTNSPLAGLTVPDEYDTPEKMYEYIEMYLIRNGKLVTQDVKDNDETKEAIRKMLNDDKDYLKYTRILEHSHLVELGLESLPINAVYVVNYFGTDVIGPIY